MANIWGQDMRGMGGLGGYSSLMPAMNSNVYFPQTRSVQSSLTPPNTALAQTTGTPSILSGMTGSQYQTPPMTGQPWPGQARGQQQGMPLVAPQPPPSEFDAGMRTTYESMINSPRYDMGQSRGQQQGGQLGGGAVDMNLLNNLPPWVDRGGWGGRSQTNQPQMAGQARGQQQGDQTTSSVTYNNPWWNQGRYNIGGQGADMAQRRRPPQIGGGGARRFDMGYGQQQGAGFPWNTGSYAPGGNSPLNNSLWQALQQRGFGTIPGGAPEGWQAYQNANGNIEYNQPGGGNWYRYNPTQGWYDSSNPAGGYSNVNPFANITPGGANATTSAY